MNKYGWLCRRLARTVATSLAVLCTVSTTCELSEHYSCFKRQDHENVAKVCAGPMPCSLEQMRQRRGTNLVQAEGLAELSAVGFTKSLENDHPDDLNHNAAGRPLLAINL